MNAVSTWRALAALTVALFTASTAGAGSARAGDAPPAGGTPPPPAASGSTPAASAGSGGAAASASPVSATGLLPIFGVAVDFDALSEKAKPDEAVAAVQKLWDGRLKAAGFNVIQFPVEVKELGDKGAGRLAKLCVWAKANSVRLAPTLIGAEPGQAIPSDYPDKAGAFAAKTIELVGKSDPQAYATIMFYQLERPLNHPGNHGAMDTPQAADLLAKTVEKLHAAEQGALAGSSLQATPVLAAVSFDYELIRVGAIANVPITDDAYNQACGAMHDYLTAVLNAAPIDVVGLEWFPGSFSSNAVDRFTDVIGKIQADFPGKLLLVHTGFSTAAGDEKAQSNYYTQTFNNLSDMRTNQGVESSFAGIVWRTAMDKAGGEPAPPSPKALEEMSSWNWGDRAAELTRMWNEPGADSKEMRWWLGRVESHFGLLGATKDISKPGEPKVTYQILTQLKNSLAVAAQATGAGDIAQQLSAAGGSPKGIAGAVKDKLQAALFGMLDAWVAKTAENLTSGGGDNNGSGGGGSPPPPPAPKKAADLQIMGIGEVDAITSGTPLPLAITVLNAGTVGATNVVLYLRENGSTDLANSSPTTISPGGSSTISMTWTPSHPGNYPHVSLDAYCDNEGDPSTNHADLGDVPVSPPSGNGGGNGGGNSGGGNGGKLGGGRYGVLNPGVLGTAGAKGSSGLVTKTDPGFIQIQAVRGISPMPMSTMSAPGTGNGTGGSLMSIKSGGGTAGGGTTAAKTTGGSSGTLAKIGGAVSPGSAGATAGGAGGSGGGTSTMSYHMESAHAPSGPQPMALAFTVTNPFDHMFTAVKATLTIQDKVIATKDLGVLFPNQQRTVSFAEWTPPHAGTFPVKIDLAGLGPGGKPLKASAMDQISTSGEGGAGGSGGSSTRSVLAERRAPGGHAGGGPMPLMRGTTTQTRLLTPLMAAPASGPAGGMATRSLLSPAARVGTIGFAPSIFGLSANSITVTPFPAQVGGNVTVSVRLFNSERAAANHVKVEAFVDGDKLGETTIDLPVARPVIASGFGAWKAKPGRHEVRAVVTAGARSGSASKPMDVRPPNGGIGVASLIGRAGFASTRLVVGANDIRLSPPVPGVGAPVDLSVHVQNPGTSDAKGVSAEIFIDAVRLGGVTGDVAAGKDLVFTGFPKWTPTAGKHTILFRATVAGQITEASRDVTAGAGLAITRATLTSPSAAGGTSPGTTPAVGLRTGVVGGLSLTGLSLRPDLQIGVGDITFMPMSPKPGDPLTISITVHNIGNAAANGGSVHVVLQVDGSQSAANDFPVSIPAQGVTTLSWPVTTPSGKQLTALANASIANDARADNNQAQATTSVGIVLVRPQILLVPTH